MCVDYGGLAQLARASALHAEGHRFDSDILHINDFSFLLLAIIYSSLTYWEINVVVIIRFLKQLRAYGECLGSERR
jgi:hypothetical protein